MERITSKRIQEEAENDLANEMGYSHIWKRLQEIENILGDDYDLEHLKELVEADKEGKVHICQKTTSNRYFAGTDENGKPIYKETDIYVRR